MAEFKYDYTVVRSKRRTLGLSIFYDGRLVVRAPYGLPDAYIEDFLVSKSRWIDSKLSLFSDRNVRFADVIAYRKVLVGGVPCDLRTGFPGSFDGRTLCCESLSAVYSVLYRYVGGALRERFNRILGETGFICYGLTFSAYRSKWGCCDVKKHIALGYAVMMLPPSLQDYVILHELCHTVEMNHSEAFWSLVSSFMPDYKARIRAVKDYSFLTRLY